MPRVGACQEILPSHLEADRIFLLASNGRHGRLIKVGMVDDLKDKIEPILKGRRAPVPGAWRITDTELELAADMRNRLD
ncbi:MAG: hypothetical protein HY698_05560 [Deltaproteobacteria bacterium]|nr:hypothetical protein [Deltaproteobacteria bacterium]